MVDIELSLLLCKLAAPVPDGVAQSEVANKTTFPYRPRPGSPSPAACTPPEQLSRKRKVGSRPRTSQRRLGPLPRFADGAVCGITNVGQRMPQRPLAPASGAHAGAAAFVIRFAAFAVVLRDDAGSPETPMFSAHSWLAQRSPAAGSGEALHRPSRQLAPRPHCAFAVQFPPAAVNATQRPLAQYPFAHSGWALSACISRCEHGERIDQPPHTEPSGRGALQAPVRVALRPKQYRPFRTRGTSGRVFRQEVCRGSGRCTARAPGMTKVRSSRSPWCVRRLRPRSVPRPPPRARRRRSSGRTKGCGRTAEPPKTRASSCNTRHAVAPADRGARCRSAPPADRAGRRQPDTRSLISVSSCVGAALGSAAFGVDPASAPAVARGAPLLHPARRHRTG